MHRKAVHLQLGFPEAQFALGTEISPRKRQIRLSLQFQILLHLCRKVKLECKRYGGIVQSSYGHCGRQINCR